MKANEIPPHSLKCLVAVVISVVA